MTAATAQLYLNNVSFAGADVVPLFNRQDEYTAITDFSRASRFDDCFDGIVNHFIRDDEFNHDLRQQSDAVFRSAVDGLVALLSSMAANLCHRHAGNAEL